jgi:hypothetical protein
MKKKKKENLLTEVCKEMMSQPRKVHLTISKIKFANQKILTNFQNFFTTFTTFCTLHGVKNWVRIHFAFIYKIAMQVN